MPSAIELLKNHNYSHMPGNQGGPVGRLQGQETTADNIEAARPTGRMGNDGAKIPDGRDEPDRLL